MTILHVHQLILIIFFHEHAKKLVYRVVIWIIMLTQTPKPLTDLGHGLIYKGSEFAFFYFTKQTLNAL